MKKSLREIIVLSSLLVLATIIFIVVAVMIYKNNGDIALDNSIRDAVYDFRGEKGGFIYYIFRFITEFGYLYVGVLLGIIGIFYTKIDRGLILFAFGFLFSYVLNSSIKLMYDRERPVEAMRWMVDNESSFPSGHSCSAMFLYSFINFYLFKTKRNNIVRYSALVFSIIIIPLVMFSRLVMGMHYFTDVIAGASVGMVAFVITAFMYLIFERYDLFTDGFIKFKVKKDEEVTNS